MSAAERALDERVRALLQADRARRAVLTDAQHTAALVGPLDRPGALDRFDPHLLVDEGFAVRAALAARLVRLNPAN